MQFSKRSRAWPCRIGSLSNTSIAAMPGRPRLRPAINASGAMSSARDVLTNKEVVFIDCRSSKVTMPRVASFKRRCKLTMSDWLKNSSLLEAASNPCSTADAREASLPQSNMRIPNALP